MKLLSSHDEKIFKKKKSNLILNFKLSLWADYVEKKNANTLPTFTMKRSYNQYVISL